jgi:hypothetical protein
MSVNTRIPRNLRRSAPLLEQPLLHDVRRVAGNLIERLLGGSQVGYKLTHEEQYLLALAAMMHAAIQHNEWTSEYELKVRNGARAA